MSQEERNRIKHVSVEIKFRTTSGYSSRDLSSTRHSLAPDPGVVLRNGLRELVRLLTLEGNNLADINDVVETQYQLTRNRMEAGE